MHENKNLPNSFKDWQTAQDESAEENNEKQQKQSITDVTIYAVVIQTAIVKVNEQLL